MLQPKHPLTALVSHLVQGIFRAGHLSLIALGLFALSQIVPVPLASTRSVHSLDAMGGSADALVVNETNSKPGYKVWFSVAKDRIAETIAGFTSPLLTEVVAEELPVAEPALTTTPVPANVSRLSDYLATRYRVSNEVVEGLIVTAQSVGKELGVDPLLIVSVMAVESSFNPLSESRFGAQGLMQVIPKYHMDKLGDDAHKLALFEPATNIRVGALVLKEYIRRAGSVEAALQYYAGASNDEEFGYSRKVLGTREKFLQVMRG